MKRLFLLTSSICLFLVSSESFSQQSKFSSNPDSVTFYTSDIDAFWKVFDETYPKLSSAAFQEKYINVGSKGLQGFINNRIVSGRNLCKKVKRNLDYYESIRKSSLSIAQKEDRFYECFRNLKQLYPEAVFPDVYFVIGAKNSGGTTFKEGLIIGAEMFGKPTTDFKPVLEIDYVDEVVAHELVHFQQNYPSNNTLLAQSIKEGAADFIGVLISGAHSNGPTYEFGDAHELELWNEFKTEKNSTKWSSWLYSSKDKSRPRDLGYWMGYQIIEAYYNKASDKAQAIKDILNIQDFEKFLEDSGYSPTKGT